MKNSTQKSLFCLATLFILLFGLGCTKKSGIESVNEYKNKSQKYYLQAISEYEKLIAKDKSSEQLILDLGELYYSHGEFEKAAEQFQKLSIPRARKMLALSYYNMGNFVDALDIFNKTELSDEEYAYYHGLTCEKLNLFDQALAVYKNIKSEEFKEKAGKRVNIIQHYEQRINIKDIDPKAYAVIEGAPSEEAYPQAGALILYCDEKIEVKTDGTKISTLHYLIKILNERGKENFSEMPVGYDSTYEKVELEYARTIKPDGSVAEVGSRHIRDVSKYLNFPLYSNARVFIISFPEITDGAVVEYKVKIYDNQLVNKKDFVNAYPIQSSEPIIHAIFSVSCPKDKPLNIKNINEKYNFFKSNFKPNTEEQGGYLTYVWEFKDIPQIIPEPDMPAEVEINPTFLISTFNSWDDVYKWWWGLAKDKIKADEAIREKVKELSSNKDTEEDKIRSIYNFCAKDIRYVAVEYGQAGYEPHFAADIFKNKYGDCKDQAILLVTMLKEAGFNAYPVLIATDDYYNLNQDFPSILFDHCIAAIDLAGKIIFMDPTAQTCSFGDLPSGDQNRKVLVFKPDQFTILDTPLYPNSHNFLSQDLNIKVSDGGSINAHRFILAKGIYAQAQRYWLLYTQPELIRDFLGRKAQEISIGAKLDRYDINNLDDLNKDILLSYSFSGPEYFTCAGTLRIMPQLANIDVSSVAKYKRRYPLDLSALDTKENIFNIEFPQGFIVKYLPKDSKQDSPWLNFSAEYSYSGNKICFKQQVCSKVRFISEQDYPGYKSFIERIAKEIKQRIVLEKAK